MKQIILLAIAAVEALLPTLAGATSGQLQSVILLMERIIPAAAQLSADAIISIENIIQALTSHSAVTAEQIAALTAQSAALDASLDAAATDDGIV